MTVTPVGAELVQQDANEKGFEVRSPCGSVWLVPLSKVQEDYADFLQKEDNLERAAAHAQALEDEEAIHSWFCEQFSWADVLKYGTPMALPSPADVERALSFYRVNSGLRPVDCYKDSVTKG